jgi:hypothetical protein
MIKSITIILARFIFIVSLQDIKEITNIGPVGIPSPSRNKLDKAPAITLAI